MLDQPRPTRSSELDPAHLDTRARLLWAGGQTFAEHGFRDTTVREICERASANVAAVNYHFGDKEGLYRAVFAEAHAAAMSRYPVDTAYDQTGPPEAQLRGFVRNFVRRLLDDGAPSWHGQLMAREMVDPTGVLDEVARHFVRPQFERLCAIVRLFLGSGADPDRVVRCACSVAGQCLFYKHARPMIDRAIPEVRFDERAREDLAEHIAAFSVAALRGVGA